MTEPKTYTIDAQGRTLGRVATEVATILRGKHDASFAPHRVSNVRVVVINASRIDLAPKKKDEVYTRYSGYPGGLKMETRESLIDRKGYKAIFEKAISGMLPANKLRKEIMKNLTIQE